MINARLKIPPNVRTRAWTLMARQKPILAVSRHVCSGTNVSVTFRLKDAWKTPSHASHCFRLKLATNAKSTLQKQPVCRDNTGVTLVYWRACLVFSAFLTLLADWEWLLPRFAPSGEKHVFLACRSSNLVWHARPVRRWTSRV